MRRRMSSGIPCAPEMSGSSCSERNAGSGLSDPSAVAGIRSTVGEIVAAATAST